MELPLKSNLTRSLFRSAQNKLAAASFAVVLGSGLVWYAVPQPVTNVHVAADGPSSSPCEFPTCFPDAGGNTGVLDGIVRTSGGSGFTTTSNGQVIQNLNMTGPIDVIHDDVTISNVQFDLSGTGSSIAVTSCNLTGNACVGVSGLTIEDVEVIGPGPNQAGTGSTSISIWQQNNVIRRVYVHEAGESFGSGTGGTLEDSFVHVVDASCCGCVDPQCPHQDVLGQWEYGTNISIHHNTCVINNDEEFTRASSCFQIGGDLGNSNNTAEHNLFGGACNICARMGGSSGQIRNNHFTIGDVIPGNEGSAMSTFGGVTTCGNEWIDGPNEGPIDSACGGGFMRESPLFFATIIVKIKNLNVVHAAERLFHSRHRHYREYR